MRLAACAPCCPCCGTPVASTATYATVLPVASLCHAQSCDGPKLLWAVWAAANRKPAASVVRSTVDSASSSPASLGNTFSLASAKLVWTPATQATSAAPGLKAALVTPNTASHGQQPWPHAAQW